MNQEIESCLEHIPIRLRAARRARGYLNRTVFAQVVDKKLSTYRTHETGEVELAASDIIRYAKILNISISWLLTGEGNPFNHYKKPPTQKEEDDFDDALRLALFRARREQMKQKNKKQQ